LSATAIYRDPQVGTLDRLSLKDAQLVVSQEALRWGALTPGGLGPSDGPVEAVRVSIRSPLWATTLATIYFAAEHEATAWTRDLLTRLPRIARPRSGARAPVWRAQLSAARILGSHVVGGAVLAVLEPDSGRAVRASLANGDRSGTRSARNGDGRDSVAGPLGELAGAVAGALKAVDPAWITATVARITHARSGNVFFALEDGDTAFDAVIFAATARKLERLPGEGEILVAHVARASLYQPRGQLTLVLDQLSRPGGGHAG
jgi:hypothetical protein